MTTLKKRLSDIVKRPTATWMRHHKNRKKIIDAGLVVLFIENMYHGPCESSRYLHLVSGFSSNEQFKSFESSVNDIKSVKLELQTFRKTFYPFGFGDGVYVRELYFCLLIWMQDSCVVRKNGIVNGIKPVFLDKEKIRFETINVYSEDSDDVTTCGIVFDAKDIKTWSKMRLKEQLKSSEQFYKKAMMIFK